MDSYNFHFERMSNVDLHPLNLPVNRLSPAKSNSSIVEQFAHHQHGKGDSAYSSFSGGSTVPDYSSPFFQEDIQSSSFGHYADLKFVKSICQPSQLLQADPKTMDQLYRSVEAISQQYRNNPSSNLNHQNGNDSFQSNNKALVKDGPSQGPSRGVNAYIRPPPIPTRLDSFIATKNLENSQGHRHGNRHQPMQPQPQQPRLSTRPQSQGLNTPRAERSHSETSALSCSSDTLYAGWRTQQAPQPPVYRLHLQTPEQTRGQLHRDQHFLTENKVVSEQPKSGNIPGRSPPRGTSLTELLRPRQLSSTGGCNGDHHNKPGSNRDHVEGQRKRAHSAHDFLGSEPSRLSKPWDGGQSVINSSIQHKGQFYFVTGLCKMNESGMETNSVCGSEDGSESSTVVHRHKPREKERSRSTMDCLSQPLKETSQSTSGIFQDDRDVFNPEVKGKDLIWRSLDQENHRPSLSSTRTSRSFDSLEEINNKQGRDISRHTDSNPIFYCGPEKSCSPCSNSQIMEEDEQRSQHKSVDQAKRGARKPLSDVASERINKETTPLLYHLTGASRTGLQPKKESAIHKTGRAESNNLERSPQGVSTKNAERSDMLAVACNTLDDSFKKYYKEKLQDVQSKVLSETSFKRKDLQLSWPHRLRPKPELRPTAIHSFSSSQDSETSTETLIPFSETESESVVAEQRELNKEPEKDSTTPTKVAQPQVARIGAKKRLTPEQKKMCYSEPEKLNQVGTAPKHSSCRSFGNESETLFASGSEGEEHAQQGDLGFVATRRKMFETRSRALSACSTSKTSLKDLQHKALVEYMERKTGQKVAEPQQPAPQVPPSSRHRHSLGEKPFDWGSRPLSASQEKNPKKKLHRPHSAGRILDSSTSSVRYAQFFSAQSCSGQYVGPSNQPRWRESQGPGNGKSASADSLLDQPEPPNFFRNRSTSTPHAFQAHDYETDPALANATETMSPEKSTEATPPPQPSTEAPPVRMVAQRGKSMEELGATKLTKISALSKSSEQLDQLWRKSARDVESEKDKRNMFAQDREAQGQERARKSQQVSNQIGKEPEVTRPKTLKDTKTRSLDVEGSTRVTARTPAGSISPASQAKESIASAGSHSPVTDECKSVGPPSESPDPVSPCGQESGEKEIKSTSSTPTQIKPPCENRRSSRASPVTGSKLSEEESKNEPEVSLSCGVTTDPLLWLPPPEDEITEDVQKEAALADNESGELSSSKLSSQTVPMSPSTSVSEVTQQVEEESPRQEDENTGENREVGGRGTPEGATDSSHSPVQKPQWEDLVEALVQADQSLAPALYPLTNRKTALMLMEQLLSEDTLLMEEHYKMKQRGESVASDGAAERSPSPVASKPQQKEQHSKLALLEKKRLLVSYIEEQLSSLEELRSDLRAEIQENKTHGEALKALVRDRCQPLELERYTLFIGDLERVVNLLLCLSARLARVQNALSTVDQHTDAEEKESLDSRHRLLCKQREDAKDLKDNLDRRENLVSTFLSRQLSAEQLQDYRRFVQTKASLLIRLKDLEEKQRLGEEQLEALANSSIV
ncbi:protein Shroom1 isoform 1-T2 [Synchiropus picturatus]